MLLGLAVVVSGSIWLVVAGVVDIGRGASLTERLGSGTEQALGGVGSPLSGLFSGAVSLGIGAAMAAFLVYYVLVDWAALELGRPEPRPGYRHRHPDRRRRRRVGAPLRLSPTLSAVVTLVTSYVPYLGAIVSGTFATLIALGSEGVGTALVMLVAVLAVQNVVQTIVLARLASTALRLHPFVALGSTILGAALAGMLGAALSSPAVAVGLMVRRRLSGSAEPGDAGDDTEAGAQT